MRGRANPGREAMIAVSGSAMTEHPADTAA
jgi:hypothetical protein